MVHIIGYAALTGLLVTAINIAIGYRADKLSYKNKYEYEELVSEGYVTDIKRLEMELEKAEHEARGHKEKAIDTLIENQDLKIRHTDQMGHIKRLTQKLDNTTKQRDIYESALNKVDPTKLHVDFTLSKSGKATPYARLNKFTIEEALEQAERYESDVI